MSGKGMRIYYDGAGGDGGGGGGGGSSGTLLNGEGGGSGTDQGNGGEGPKGGPADFKLPDNWDYRSVLPPELKESPSAKKYANIVELVRGADNAQQLIGKDPSNLVEIPPNMDAKGRSAILARLGLPQKIDDYKVAAPKEGGESMKLDHPNFKALTAKAHELGILPDQFQSMVEAFGSLTAKGHQDMANAEIARNADNVKALKNEWGEAFDDKVAKANFAVEKLGGDKAGIDALRESINRAGMGTDGPLLKALSKVGEMLGEDETGGQGGGVGAPMTPDAAKGEGMRLLNEAINSKDPIEQRRLNAEAQKFFEKAAKRGK